MSEAEQDRAVCYAPFIARLNAMSGISGICVALPPVGCPI